MRVKSSCHNSQFTHTHRHRRHWPFTESLCFPHRKRLRGVMRTSYPPTLERPRGGGGGGRLRRDAATAAKNLLISGGASWFRGHYAASTKKLLRQWTLFDTCCAGNLRKLHADVYWFFSGWRALDAALNCDHFLRGNWDKLEGFERERVWAGCSLRPQAPGADL